jgi:hypothetical protein
MLRSRRAPLLMIEVRSQAEAECVADALESFGTELKRLSDGWVVAVAHGEREFTAVFAMLEDCLRDNGIAAVKLAVANRRYVMEAPPYMDGDTRLHGSSDPAMFTEATSADCS